MINYIHIINTEFGYGIIVFPFGKYDKINSCASKLYVITLYRVIYYNNFF